MIDSTDEEEVYVCRKCLRIYDNLEDYEIHLKKGKHKLEEPKYQYNYSSLSIEKDYRHLFPVSNIKDDSHLLEDYSHLLPVSSIKDMYKNEEEEKEEETEEDEENENENFMQAGNVDDFINSFFGKDKPAERKKHRCIICGDLFNTEYELNLHIDAIHIC